MFVFVLLTTQFKCHGHFISIFTGQKLSIFTGQKLSIFTGQKHDRTERIFSSFFLICFYRALVVSPLFFFFEKDKMTCASPVLNVVSTVLDVEPVCPTCLQSVLPCVACQIPSYSHLGANVEEMAVNGFVRHESLVRFDRLRDVI